MYRTICCVLSAIVLYGVSAAHAQDSEASVVTAPTTVATPAVAAATVYNAAEAQPNPVPLNTEVTRRRLPNLRLLATGSALLVVSYVPAIIGAAVSDRAGDDNMYIPIAGPWMAMARGAHDTAGQKALFTIDGAIQGLGGLAMLLSVMIPEETTKHWYLFGNRDRVQLSPQVAWNSAGLSASGHF